MNWVCSVCGREFKNKNQSHSCEVSEIEIHFLDKEPVVIEIYVELIKAVNKFGQVRINPVKNAIIIQSDTSFLALKPKKKCLDLEFLLDYRSNYTSIIKTVKASKSKYAHFVKLSTTNDITEKLVSLLKESYNLNRY